MNREPLRLDQLVRDQLGHWCTVVEIVNPWLYFVQYPHSSRRILTGRSELRADGE